MDCHKKHKTPGGTAHLLSGYSRAATTSASVTSLFVFFVASPSDRSAPFAPSVAQLL
jgi:hypothetical protein